MYISISMALLCEKIKAALSHIMNKYLILENGAFCSHARVYKFATVLRDLNTIASTNF